MRRTALLPALMLLASLTACASPQTAYQARTGDSLALSVMRAAGYQNSRLRDASGPLPANWNPGGSGLGAAVAGLADAGGLASTIASPLPGLTSLSGGLLAGAAVLTRPERPPEEAFSRVIAWMPRDQAADPIAAREKFVRLVTDAFDRGLQEAGLAGRFSSRLAVAEYPLLTQTVRVTHGRFDFSPPPCGEAGIRCDVGVLGSMHVPEIVTAPGFTGAGDAYLFGIRGAGILLTRIEDQREWRTRILARFPFLEALLATSRHLPGWAYIYVAPIAVSHREPGTNRFIFLQTPLVLHQGRVLPFVAGHESPAGLRTARVQ